MIFCLACDESRGRRDIGIAFPAAAAAASTFDVRVFAHMDISRTTHHTAMKFGM